MNAILFRKPTQAASSLLTVMIIGTILSVGTVTYLSLIEHQNVLSSRSQTWNTAIALTEAGLEEGLQQLNSNTWNLTSDGWTASGATYSITRNLSETTSYMVTIDMSVDPYHPTLYSRAYINCATIQGRVPGAVTRATPSIWFASMGLPVPGPTTIARAVRVRCARGNMLIKGIVAKHRIEMNGNNILTDSFDSGDPNYSTAGMYDPAKAKANGDVATNDALANSMTTGNANVHGHVVTGPGGKVAIGPRGGVGTQAWVASNMGKIQDNYFSDNANFTFPDQILPYDPSGSDVQFLTQTNLTLVVTNWIRNTNVIVSSTYPNPEPNGGVITNKSYITTNTWQNIAGIVTNCASTSSSGKGFPALGTFCTSPPPWQNGNGKDNNSTWYWYSISGYTYPAYTYTYNLYSTNYTVTTNTYNYVLESGKYYLNSVPLSGNTLVLGDCCLVLPKGIDMKGTDFLQISQSGSLSIYADANCSIGGNGIVNQNGYAINCQLFGTPNVKSITFNGNGTFIGVVVAPNAFVTMNGGGNAYDDFIGCLMADSVKMNGHFKFHYDEALSRTGANSRYLVTSWDEIDPQGY